MYPSSQETKSVRSSNLDTDGASIDRPGEEGALAFTRAAGIEGAESVAEGRAADRLIKAAAKQEASLNVFFFTAITPVLLC
ncbi:hypothetical protein [Sphingobium sp. SCG-1]|uniref:hypothetical protein n=1 Tax=Sphingobium sp. SCG-1 TaxID=2072936 RepID=UPI0016707FE8|nr:hypothetical protein [Sphingobium sp. SCG-1]